MSAFDVAIIGAGPAGSTLARLLGGQLRVLLVDRRDLRAPGMSGADKCCGGLLAPDAQQVLGRLRLGLPRGVLCGPQLFAVHTLDFDSGTERYYQRFYINVDRQAFDLYLLELVPTTTDIRLDTRCLTVEREGASFRLALQAPGGLRQRVTARVVVGADGATSLVRQKLFADRPRPRRYLALQQWRRISKTPPPHFVAVFDRRITDFYCWTIPKQDLLVIGAALFPGGDIRGRFALLEKNLAARGVELGELVRQQAAPLFRPLSPRHIFLGAQRAALVGEAAGLISPSSAEGLSFAMLSARALARALGDGLDDFLPRYRAGCRGLVARILIKNLKSPFMYRPALRRWVMRSGLGSMNVDGQVMGAEVP